MSSDTIRQSEISLSFYSFVTKGNFGTPFDSRNDRKKGVSINWVMPPPAPESGGHINMFRFICGLEARGFDCRVVVCNDGMGIPMTTPTKQLFKQINQWYGEFNGSVHYAEDMPQATMTMATGWQTAYCVNQFLGTAHKGYFVQDYEPLFFPAGAEASFAEQTYKFGFTGFTAGSWLSDTLRSKYGMKTYPISFSYDKERYFQRPNKRSGPKQLLCYVRPVTVRRGWELVNVTLELIHKRDPEIQFVLVGGEVDTKTLEYPAENPGSVALDELGNLYSQCDAALILSFSNLSLLPLEVMSCGVPVVSNKGDNVEWLLNEQVTSLANSDPKSMADAVLNIINLSEDEHQKLVDKSVAFANRSNWEDEFDKLASVISEQTTVLKSAA